MRHRLKKIGLGGAASDEQMLANRARRAGISVEEMRAVEDAIRAEGDAIRANRFPDRDAPSDRGGSSSASRAGGSDEGGNDGIPMYRPPKLGEMSYGASYSYLETLDLVSDGPIEGLVNQNGVRVNNKAILQGIYLDGTPVGTTVNPFNERADQDLVANVDSPIALGAVTGDLGIITGFFGAITGSNASDININPTGQQITRTLTVNNFNNPTTIVESTPHGTDLEKAPNWTGEPRNDKSPLWRDIEVPANNAIVGALDIRNGYRSDSWWNSRQGYGQIKASSLAIRNPIGTGVSGVGGNGDHHYGCYIGQSSEETDPSLNYLPPTGSDKAQIMPTINWWGNRSAYYDMFFTAQQDYLLYSDTTGILGLLSQSDPLNPVGSEYGAEVQGTNNYKFLFGYGSNGWGSLFLGPVLNRRGGNRRVYEPSMPGVYHTDRGNGEASHLSFFGGRSRLGTSRWGKDSSATKLATILLREVIDLIEQFNDGIARKDTGGLYQAYLCAQALEPIMGDIGFFDGSPYTVNVDAIFNKLKTYLNTIGGANVAEKNHNMIMVYRPDKTVLQEGLQNLPVIDEMSPAVYDDVDDDIYQYFRIIPHSFRFETSDFIDVSLLAAKNNDLFQVHDVIAPSVSDNGRLTGYLRGFYLISFPCNNGVGDGNQFSTLIDTNAGGVSQPGFTNAWEARMKLYAECIEGGTFESEDANGDPLTINEGFAGVLSRITSLKYKTVQGNTIGTPPPAANPNEDFPDVTKMKYNYSNVLAEVKYGEEGQAPFKFFNRVNIDKFYNAKLYGPFRRGRNVMRIKADSKMLTPTQFNKQGSFGSEGSEDTRRVDGEDLTYSDWAKGLTPDFNEPATPVIHTVYNPNVDEVFVTLGINSLKDTLHKEVSPDALADEPEEDARKLSPATSYPALLGVQIDVGYIDPRNGKKIPKGNSSRRYKFVAIINSKTLVDLGNPSSNPADYTWIKEGGADWNSRGERSNKINQPIALPPVRAIDNDGVPLAGGGDENEIFYNRYVAVTKLSAESNSVLLHRDVDLSKVTEIINCNLTYPFSAVIGTKYDSRSIESPPARSFDCKLKKVKVPSNYFAIGRNGFDRRYWPDSTTYNEASEEKKRVYVGDWDGTFKDELEWTDNPAWILYDLLTSKRYGLGQQIEEETINKWQLYKIARFCDAVNEEGVFEGVSDGHGGLEPRFSCNIVFDQGQKIYDAINTIVSLFRGSVFFGSNEVSFVDDRPRTPVNLITNESVKDGQFAYSNHRRDETFNTIEVSYNDRFSAYEPKVEVVENEKDIKTRGIFKTRIEGVGLTSRAMARRAGMHHMLHKTIENQTVAFTAGLPTLLCQPGDLIYIEDELKTNIQNFGKILDVDVDKQEIRVSNKFIDSTMTGQLMVYDPTGVETITGTEGIADRLRSRKINQICINNTITPDGHGGSAGFFTMNLTGFYGFSGYTAGYDNVGNPDHTLAGGNMPQAQEQYPLYTGDQPDSEKRAILFFNNQFTGWTFATGSHTDETESYYIASDTGKSSLLDLERRLTTLDDYDSSVATRRGAGGNFFADVFSGGVTELNTSLTHGILNKEIDVVSPSQVTTLNLTGSPNPILQDYGTLISGVDKPEVLSRLKVGSPCKFLIKDASPFIYKILDIKEENPNEFIVSATLYETGKFNLIENDLSMETLPNTYSYQIGQTINGITFENLSGVENLSATTGLSAGGLYYISGAFTDPNPANRTTGYAGNLQGPAGREVAMTAEDTTGILFTDLDTVGVYTLSVKALGNAGADGFEDNAYFDSQYSTIPVLLIPQETEVQPTQISEVEILPNF
jgi:hypothetical protein